MDREFISIREACGILGVGRSTVYRMIGEDVLPTVKLGSRRLVRLAALRELASQSSIVIRRHA